MAIVDIRMPPTYRLEGLEAALELRRRHPGIGVLVLSQHLETSHALELLQDDGGGVGYLLKERVTDVGQLADAVRHVADGRSRTARSSPSATCATSPRGTACAS